MPDQLVQGKLDVAHPGSASPFTVLTVNTVSFGVVSNLSQSYFITASDLGSGSGAAFSVRGDGLVSTRSIQAQGTIEVRHPGSGAPFSMLTLATNSFATPANQAASYFIVARDVYAGPNGSVPFSVRGDGLVTTSTGYRFPDGSVQTTAQVRGPEGKQGIQGIQGPPGSLPPNVLIGQATDGSGQIRTAGTAGATATFMGQNSLAANAGILGVTNLSGAQAGLIRAQMSVDASGTSFVQADVKSFQIPHPIEPDVDIVYACVEGPEAAAYVRGTSQLSDGRCTVNLPDHFTYVVLDAGLTVLVTPSSAKSLGLAVTSRSKSQFVVEELGGGSGNYPFDWIVTGVRTGYEGYQVNRPRSTRTLPQ